MLHKYVKLVSREVAFDHMLHIFALRLVRGSMIHMRPRGSRSLVMKIHDQANHHFYVKYFYVRAVHIVMDPTGFFEKWNSARTFL